MSLADECPKDWADHPALMDDASFEIHAHHKVEELESVWRELQKQRTGNIYQNYDWVRLAIEHLEASNTALILHGKNHKETCFILPLVIEDGAIKLVRWPGKSHANICSGLYSEGFLRSASAADMEQIVDVIKSHVSGPAILQLCNQPQLLAGLQNPMAWLPRQDSTNLMYSMDISQGMDAVLNSGNAKRKRKLFRKRSREAEDFGGFELVSPQTAEEIDAALEDFFHQKALRFKELGIENVFEAEEVRNFVRAVMTLPECDGVKLQQFFELKVAGKTRAMYGCALFHDYCQAWINSTTYDDFAKHGPGEMVLYLMIERLIENGFSSLDLGVGTERYKVSWCGQGQPLFDVIMPLSVIASPYVALHKAKTGLKNRLRNDDRFWQPIKKFRKLKASLSE
ncbi:MAG: GNAT family N-acetyltransferase [Pseudomonadota bacterium]